LDKFRSEDAEILVVVPEDRERASQYATAMGFEGFVVPDNEKKIYHLYGLDTSFMGVMQKSEVFVIDAAGQIAFAQGHGSPLRLPKVNEVLDVVKSLHAKHAS